MLTNGGSKLSKDSIKPGTPESQSRQRVSLTANKKKQRENRMIGREEKSEDDQREKSRSNELSYLRCTGHRNYVGSRRRCVDFRSENEATRMATVSLT